jgi:CRISPR/Cas system-associated exonuclease Cas4 (RecB family)
MDIYNQLKQNINNFPNSGTIVVQTDSESLLIKEMFFKSGRKVVSDRDVFTLDYELTRHMSQTKGLRVLSDQLYPFLFDQGAKRDSVLGALDFIKNFPDPFVEPELADVILEFLEQEDSAKNLIKTFKDSLAFASESQKFKSVPRGFANLYLSELEFSEETFFLSSLLEEMPYGFSDKFLDKKIKISEATSEWKDQVELYELHKSDSNIEFYTFEHQLEEVRSVLSLFASKPENKNIQVLFPKNRGFEKLFYLYQREFFEDQIFFLNEKEEQTIDKVLTRLSFEVSSFHTHYDSKNHKNKNKILVTEPNTAKYNLPDLIVNFFKDDFTELDLNIVSDVLVQLGPDRKLSIVDWKKIFEQEKIKLNRKHDKIQTKLNIHEYEYVSSVAPDEVWILGWSDSLFRKTGDKIFSNSLMSKLELNLGLFLPSLAKSEASSLFKNPVMHNSNVKKNITYASQSFLGGSNKPGVFKILMESGHEKKASHNKRIFSDNTLLLDKKKAPLEIRNLSASSLQRYEECPYKFYLEKVIGLNKEDDEDYFLSAKQEGSLMHKILEDLDRKDLTKENVDLKLRELVLVEDIDFNTFREGAIKDLSARMWLILQDEKKHLLDAGVIQTISEKFFKFNVDLATKSFTKEEGDFSIRGLVDRIDINSERKALVYDYKRGESGTHSLAMYKGTKLAPQLFLYCLAADQGLLGEFQDFVGFQYINLSLYKRQKGFVIRKQAEGIAKEIPSRSAVDPGKYQEKLNLFLEKLWDVLERINKEKFEAKPNPAYSGQCASCTWLGVCKKSETFI